MKHAALAGFAACALVAAAFAVPARAQKGPGVVWQIGEFNHSSIEFNHNVDFGNPKLNVIYTVGASHASDWPAYQPVSGSPDVHGRAIPFTIVFYMRQHPHGNYLLTIGLVLNGHRHADLLVTVNGKKGFYYVHRKVSYYPGDGGFDSPIYGEARLEIALPRSLLRKGENTLTLTALDAPGVTPGGSGVVYDALQLSQPRHLKNGPSMSVRPTVFYVEKNNQLFEQTDVTATLPGKVRNGSVELFVGQKHFQAALSSENDFGQQRFSFDVPAISAPAAAQAILRVNGGTRRFELKFTPLRKWTIDFVPHAHLDIGYTDFQPKVAEVHSRNIDKLLTYLPKHPNMHFSLDGSWIVQKYLASRNAAARQKFFSLARAGKIEVPAQYANLLTGYASLEELIRSTDYSYFLHRTEGIPFDYANITDVPSYTWSYASVLHALGLKYFAAAANSDRAPILLYGHWNAKAPFWWQGPDGSKVLMAYTRQYSEFWFTCGLPPEMANCEQAIPTFLQPFERPDYKPDTVLMYGSQFENTDLQLRESGFVKKWNARYAYPKFVITTFPGYLSYIAHTYGSELPTVRGDGGPYWEDGVGSDAKYTAIDRQDQQRALSGEKLSTIATFLDPNLEAPHRLIENMWQNLILYAEHTFDSWDSVFRPHSEESRSQLAVKNQYVRDGRKDVSWLVKRSLSQIAGEIHMPAGTLLVFNTLSWQRSGLVTLDLDDGSAIAEYPGGKLVPLEVLRKGAGYERVRFLAKNVPAMGYRCYQFISRPKGALAPVIVKPEQTTTMENAYYRVTVDPQTGAVKSIFDKQLGRELVDSSSPYGMDQYLYVSGGGKRTTQIVYLQKSLPLARLTIHPSTGGHVVGLRRTPYGQVMTLESSDVHTPLIRTSIILFNDKKEIEFVNHFRKQAVRGKEAVYFAFPFAVPKPDFTYEIQNGWVDPSRDMLKGAGVEWFSVRHWVKVADSDVSAAVVPVDAPLITLGDINRGTWPETFAPKSSTIFSYALNNYWHTNYRGEQGGDFTFRYVMTSGAQLSPADLARLGRAAMTPLETERVIDQDKVGNPPRPLDPAPAGFLNVSAPNVVVEDWKAANNGQGTIVRLLEVGGRATSATLTFPLFHLEHAWLDNAVEVNEKEIPVSSSSLQVSIGAHQILTLRIAASLAGDRPAGGE
jgi:hypothetical protein